ncbi:MAG: hypothetical protein HC828_05780, partial [Blastochloris sp.]|nr:hypothetical protein [Blastochloris sp.]
MTSATTRTHHDDSTCPGQRPFRARPRLAGDPALGSDAAGSLGLGAVACARSATAGCKPAAAAELAALAQAEQPVTDHALLVLLGRFAQHLGLVRLLEAVPLVQKKVTHSPQAKLIEFLLAVLAGLGQLQELTHAAFPIASDPLLAQAWGQTAFADYAGVSRTLAAADADTLLAVRKLLACISRPFIDREVMAIVHTQQPITIDIDLTGRPVSPTATSYPDAAFGWMDDAVAKGYQSAISSLSGGPAGRWLLASQRDGGKAKSAEVPAGRRTRSRS